MGLFSIIYFLDKFRLQKNTIYLSREPDKVLLQKTGIRKNTKLGLRLDL